MTHDIKVVSPLRPYPWESPAHRKLGPFDWSGALEMMRESVHRACSCEVYGITDVDTDLPGPTHHYVTTHRRLMVWILEVSLRYLESDDFDRDTIMLSPDLLVFQDLSPLFTGADLGILVRPEAKFIARGRPILNACQTWRVVAKRQLVRFFRQALAIAVALPEPFQKWGGDTEPLRQLLLPITSGYAWRSELLVNFITHTDVMRTVGDIDLKLVRAGRIKLPAVCDFKGRRKLIMAEFYDATIGSAVTV